MTGRHGFFVSRTKAKGKQTVSKKEKEVEIEKENEIENKKENKIEIEDKCLWDAGAKLPCVCSCKRGNADACFQEEAPRRGGLTNANKCAIIPSDHNPRPREGFGQGLGDTLARSLSRRRLR